MSKLDNLFDELHLVLKREDDSAARANLTAGTAIYYRHELFDEPGQIIKEYPSGRLELVWVDNFGDQKLIRALTDKEGELGVLYQEKRDN